MVIEYVKGNLLEAPEYIIVHGCNSKGVFGSGCAKAIKEKYPEAFRKYKQWIDWKNNDPRRSRPVETGDIIPVRIDSSRMVVNAITQYNFGKVKGTVYADYDGIRRAMVNIRMLARHEDQRVIAIPFIGAGLAQGDWKIISNIITEELIHHGVSVKVYFLDQKEYNKIMGEPNDNDAENRSSDAV